MKEVHAKGVAYYYGRDEHSIKLAEEGLKTARTKFNMQLFGDEGFLLTLKGLGMHDHSSLYAKVDIGQQMLATLRGCIEDHLSWAITEKQFDNGPYFETTL